MADEVSNNMRCLVGLMVVLVSIGTAQGQGCLAGWTEYRTACFKLFTQTGAMSAANSICESFGGNIVRVKTEGIQALVQGMVLDHPEADYWLHMIRSPHITGYWTYLDGTWLIDCDFTNWGPASDGETGSNDGADYQQCARLYADTQWQWEDTPCGDLHSYICQTGDVIGTGSGSCGSAFGNSMPCTIGYMPGPGDICYKVSATVATFADAEADCASQGAKLAAPYDERTHQFIAGMAMMANPDSDHWLGITADDINGGFKFIDDTELPQCGFMKWAPDQPDMSMTSGYMKSSAAYNWAAGDSSSEKHYICQKGNDYTCERGPNSCTAEQFACPCSGCCLETAQLCDRVDDCTDGSDEAGCDYPTTEAATTTPVITTTTPAVTTTTPAGMTTTTSVDANIVTTTVPDDATQENPPSGSTRASVTDGPTTSQPGEGGSAAANTGGVAVGPVVGGVAGAVVVVGVGAAVGGYLLCKKKPVAVEPTP
ncbi:macrophage mannose receptor 1-like [Branchiostoma floridae]|uniref:Macrophage mannose receptor 1-like n=1 Tax=Branchiostoma floridae TaxID=7739 RepID=A0A9J7L981_BRAFL|nr:macrophage mannose receptor 1-like [Branchiostoma floridae]